MPSEIFFVVRRKPRQGRGFPVRYDQELYTIGIGADGLDAVRY